MKLVYHEGRNFGDALNPLVFGRLFPDMFDDDDTTQFIGIGSILGLKRPSDRTRRRVIFSSGYAAGQESTYGPKPIILPMDDVICVRGPRTAAILGLPLQAAVADGAILAPSLLGVTRPAAPTRVAFMPHVGSFWCFEGWRDLLRDEGIEFIDPRDHPVKVLQEIASCKVLLAEAMHGAILADAIGTPWIAVKCYKSINEFKWSDFCESMDLKYEPSHIDSLFDRRALREIAEAKLGPRFRVITSSCASGMAAFHRLYVRSKVGRQFRELRQAEPTLSKRHVLDSRLSRLLECAEQVRTSYLSSNDGSTGP